MFLPAPDESLWVGVLRLGLVVPGSRSLKDKRRAVAQLRDRLRARHNLSVAEVGHLDSTIRAVIGVSMVGNDARFVRSALDALRADIQSWSMALVEDAHVSVHRGLDSGTSEDLRHG